MNELLRRIWYLCNRRRLEREMADEMAYHRELMAPGRRPDFGSDLRLREDAREIWGWAWLDRVRQDLSYGARVLRNSPGFTLTAMLVLALGIAVPLTAFRVLLADLQGAPVPDPDTLVHLTRRAPGAYITNVPYPALAFYAANARSFRSVIGISERTQAVLGDPKPGADPEQIHLAFATVNYFPEFGIVPVRGRLLNTGDERPDAAPTALVGELFWKRRLGGDPAALGQSLRLNGKLVQVVGVVPTSASVRADVWMPLARHPYVIEGSVIFTDWNSALDLYARLQPGASPQSSEQETLALAARLRELRPDNVRPGEYLEARPIHHLATDSNEVQIALTAAALVLMLLMAACANLGTLVLARGVTRDREIRTRLALGASRARVVRQLFTESFLLALLSGLCALLLSSIALKVVQLQHNPDSSILPDWRILAITVFVALLSALVFGLPPALRLTSLVPHAGRARTIFLALQVGASCLLLIVSSLMVRGLQHLASIDAGFDYRHLVWISPGLKAHGYAAPAAQAYLDSLRARTAALPEVQAASKTWLAPWGNLHMGANWQGRQFAGNRVDPQFLDTLGIRLLRGRNFHPAENGVAIVTEAAARVLWPGRDPLGQTLPWDPKPVVIGVARDASTNVVGDPHATEFYLPPSPADAPESVLLLRVSGNPHDSVRRLQDAARALDPRLQPVVETVVDSYDREVQNVSRALVVITTLGAVAILLSFIGLAGLAGYTVAQRTREIGLRIALGARAAQVVRAIVAPLGRPVAIGFICGALGGSLVVKVLRVALPAMAGLKLLDPGAYLLATVLFTAVMAMAVLAPARRAIRITPAKALQHE